MRRIILLFLILFLFDKLMATPRARTIHQLQKNRNPPSDRLKLSCQKDRLSKFPEKPIPNYLRPTVSSCQASTSRHHLQQQAPPVPQPKNQKQTTAKRERSAEAPPPAPTRRRIPATKPRTPTPTLPPRPSTAVSSKSRALRAGPVASPITATFVLRLPSLAKGPRRPLAFRNRPRVNRAASLTLSVIPEEDDEKASDVSNEAAREEDTAVEDEAFDRRCMESVSDETGGGEEVPPPARVVEKEEVIKVRAKRSKVKALAGALESVFWLQRRSERKSCWQEQSPKAMVVTAESRGWSCGANSRDKELPAVPRSDKLWWSGPIEKVNESSLR